MEVFFMTNGYDYNGNLVDFDIDSYFWHATDGWHDLHELKSTGNAATGTSIVSISARANHMDIFWAGNSNVNGVLMYSWTNDGGVNWNKDQASAPAGLGIGNPTLEDFTSITFGTNIEAVFGVTV
jgi:hypothetical protein